MILATTTAVRHSTWHHFQARFPEWQNAIVLFAWGAYVLSHPGMMTDPRIGSLWVGLLAIASQETWGMLSMLVGLCRGAALYVNGQHKRTPLVRLIASFFSAFIITQIVIGLAHGGAPNTGLIVYPVLILADVYSAFRASADMTFVARHDIEETERGRVINLPELT